MEIKNSKNLSFYLKKVNFLKIYLPFFFLFNILLLNSQINAFSEETDFPDCATCETINTNYVTPLDSSEYKMLDELLATIGSSKSFILQPCEGAKNAYATTIDNKRYILYNKDFFNSIINEEGAYSWSNVSILAHEIGHHINGHVLDCNSIVSLDEKRQMELEADQFMGTAMYRLGATFEQASLAINTLIPFEKDDSYSSHPSKSKRLNAIKVGYNDKGTKRFISNLAESNLYKAIDFYNNGDYREANEYLSAVIIFGLENDLVYNYKGKINFEINNYKDALIDFNKGILFNPSSSELYVNRAKVKFAIDEYSKDAIADLDLAIKLNPSNPMPYIIKARDGFFDLKFSEIISLFDKSISLDSLSYEAYYEKALYIKNAHEFYGYELFTEEYEQTVIYRDKESDFFDIGIKAVSKALDLRPGNEIMSKLFFLRGKLIENKKEYLESDMDYDSVISNYVRCIDINSKSYDCNYGLGYIKWVLEEYDSSIKYFNRYFELFEDLEYQEKQDVIDGLGHANASFYLANIYGHKENYEKAIEILDRGIEINPLSETLYHWRGMAKGSIGDSFGNLSDHKRAFELDNTNTIYMDNIAGAMMDLELYKDAVEYFEKIIKIDSTDYLSYSRIGYIYTYELVNHNKAIDYYNKALKKLTENSVSYIQPEFNEELSGINYEVAYNLYNIDENNDDNVLLDKALISVKKSINLKQNVGLDYGYDESYNLMGLIYNKQKKLEDAFKSFELANTFSEQKDSEILYNLGRGYWYLENNDEAIYYLKKSYELNPLSSDPLILISRIKNFEAAESLSVGDETGAKKLNESAINYLKKVEKINPDYREIYLNFGIIYYDLKDYIKSINNYKKAIELGQADFYSMIFHDLAESQKKIKKYYDAIYNYKKSIDLLESQVEIAHLHNDIGLVKAIMGDYKMAIQDFEIAVKLHPEVPEYIYNLGISLKNSKTNIINGEKLIKKAKQLSKNNNTILGENIDLVI